MPGILHAGSRWKLGAIAEADRHNIRGEHISVDTIPLVGEEALADAVRGVMRLPRVKPVNNEFVVSRLRRVSTPPTGPRTTVNPVLSDARRGIAPPRRGTRPSAFERR